ncbi:hypothetical protein ACFQYP_47055 [Nonomuraea antimicrobica]
MVDRLFPRSIRARLTAIATLAAAGVVAATAALTLATVPDSLHGVLVARVELAVRRVAGDVRDGQLPGVLEPPERVALLRVVSATGDVLASSGPSHPADARVTALRPRGLETVRTTEVEVTRDPAEPATRYLVMAMTVRTPAGPALAASATIGPPTVAHSTAGPVAGPATAQRAVAGPVTVYGAASLADVDRSLRWIHALVFLGTPLVPLVVGASRGPRSGRPCGPSSASGAGWPS